MGFLDRYIPDAILRSDGESSLRIPERWLIDGLGGGPSDAGIAVNEKSALNFPALVACIRILSETMAMLPIILYRDLPEGGRERARDHALWRILHDQPNDEQTAFEFKELMVSQCIFYGNFYAEIERDNAGRALNLWPLHPTRVEPIRNKQNELFYRVHLPDGSEAVLPKRKIMHLRGFSKDGLLGYALSEIAKEPIGLGLAAQKWASKFFKQGTRPGGVIRHPGRLSEEAKGRLRNSVEAIHSGIEQAHRIAILEEGMEWQQTGLDPADAQLLEERIFQMREVARVLRIPLHLLQDPDFGTENAEHFSILYATYTVEPWCERIEQVIRRDVMGRNQEEKYTAEFLIDALLRADFETRMSGYAVGLNNAIFNLDEVRARENLNPLPNGVGKVHLRPMNLIPADKIEEMAEAQIKKMETPPGLGGGVPDVAGAGRPDPTRPKPKPREARSEAITPVLEATMERCRRREEADVVRLVRKHKGGDDELRAKLDEFYEGHTEYITRQLAPVVETLAALAGIEANEERCTEVAATWASDRVPLDRADVDEQVFRSAEEVEERLQKAHYDIPSMVDRLLTDLEETE